MSPVSISRRTRPIRRRISPLAAAAILCAASALAEPARPAGEIVRLEIRSIIHPIAAETLRDALEAADRDGAALLVVELDTPGGLLESTRDMSTAMLAARTPVAVWVSPGGAQAASAGFFLLEAADFALMAPATNAGAAHPVGQGGETIDGVLGEKIEQDAAANIRSLAGRRGRDVELAEAAVVKSRSFTADEALAAHLIDAVVPDFASLVATLDGREIEKPKGEKRRLALAGATVRTIEPPALRRFLSRIARPDLASILLTFGLLGLYFEFSHPGAVIPGVVGGICLLLAFFALSVLPVSYVGVALVALSVILFVAEVKVTSYGALTLGGIIALVLGLGMLFKSSEPALQVSRGLIATLAIVATAVAIAVTAVAVRSRRVPIQTGREALIGARAVARTEIAPRGKVFVAGEWWNAVAESGPVAAGAEVVITSVDGLVLKVRPAREGS